MPLRSGVADAGGHVGGDGRGVVDPDGREVPADAQTVGEIVVRGNVVMAGYYQDPEATQRAMGDGWFHTGDAAVVHPDGYVEIRDRLKDVIISGGENISSVEVEGVLLRHPAVQEVAIVGLPDEKWGETPHAFVVLRDGASATEPELIEFVRETFDISVLLVEHDMRVVAGSDWVIDIGPGAGDEGGRIVAEGPPEEIVSVRGSKTAPYLPSTFPPRRQWLDALSKSMEFPVVTLHLNPGISRLCHQSMSGI